MILRSNKDVVVCRWEFNIATTAMSLGEKPTYPLGEIFILLEVIDRSYCVMGSDGVVFLARSEWFDEVES